MQNQIRSKIETFVINLPPQETRLSKTYHQVDDSKEYNMESSCSDYMLSIETSILSLI